MRNVLWVSAVHLICGALSEVSFSVGVLLLMRMGYWNYPQFCVWIFLTLMCNVFLNEIDVLVFGSHIFTIVISF